MKQRHNKKTEWKAGRCREAATLAETVAAMVALTVLAVALLPAVATVPKSSKNGKCLSNLAQIGYANAIYAAQDPDEMALPLHPQYTLNDPSSSTYVGAYEWGGKSGVGLPGFVDGPTKGPDAWITSRYGTKAGFGPASRPLNRIIFKDPFEDHLHPSFNQEGALADTQLDLAVYRCPSDTGYTGVHCPSFAETGLSSYDHFGVSYNANIFMIASGMGGWVQSNSPYLRRLSDVPNPARTLAFQESNGRFAWAAGPELPECLWIGYPILGTVRGWHGKDWTFNAAYVDGHADTIYMRGYRNRLVFPTNHTYQKYYGCVIIRGEGWQIDTLPAPPVETDVYWAGGGRPSYEGCIGK